MSCSNRIPCSPSDHDSPGWRREIMRLHLMITGKPIWAGEYRSARQGKKVIHRNIDGPAGEKSLAQKAIARWPHETEIELGTLGEK